MNWLEEKIVGQIDAKIGEFKQELLDWYSELLKNILINGLDILSCIALAMILFFTYCMMMKIKKYLAHFYFTAIGYIIIEMLKRCYK